MSKKWFDSAKGLVSVSQLAINMIGPIILGIIISTYLRDKFSMGNWVVAVGVILGFGAGICAFISYLKIMIKDFEKKEK